jgi:FMN phosphatase YigB (HAD superfamily)
MNHLKDDPSYYKKALKRLSWDSQQVVSIGDSIVTDIYPAKLVGIKTVWVNRKKESQKDLNMDKIPDYTAVDLITTIDYLKSISI